MSCACLSQLHVRSGLSRAFLGLAQLGHGGFAVTLRMVSSHPSLNIHMYILTP